jgi:hypothetical protein
MAADWLRWNKGRQQSGYWKMLLATARWPLPFDIYLLKFPEGTEVPEHTDPAALGRHYRINIVLKSARKGGEFICRTPIYANSRIKFFRPDACAHSVTRVEQGSRWLLSIGWLRK